MDFWDRFAGVYDLAESINGSVYTEMCDITRRLVPAGAKVLDDVFYYKPGFTLPFMSAVKEEDMARFKKWAEAAVALVHD